VESRSRCACCALVPIGWLRRVNRGQREVLGVVASVLCAIVIAVCSAFGPTDGQNLDLAPEGPTILSVAPRIAANRRQKPDLAAKNPALLTPLSKLLTIFWCR
jgi:hypothetical protein